jgi:AraC-like DNA-binding protein
MGCFTLNAHQKNPFIASLPGTIHLTAENLQAEPGLESTIRLLTLELSRSGPGSDILVSRLTDAVFIQAIRAYISQIKKCPESPGWLKALTDPEIGTALNLMHEKPEAPWTVASLASEVNMSRTSFATKFTALVTETPIDYLTSWRMQKAIRAMQEGTESVAEIGEKVGYTSRASFAKAFKREFGHSPGEYKKQLETSAG